MPYTEKMECMEGEGFAASALVIKAAWSQGGGVRVNDEAREMGDHLLIYLFLHPVLKMDIVASSGSSMELERRKGTSHNCWELRRFSKLGVKTPHLLLLFFSSAFQHSSFSSLDGYLFSLLCLLHSSLPSLRFCFCVLESWLYCLILNNFPILRF